MTEKKIVVPDGMLKAAIDGFENDCGERCGTHNHIHAALEAALRWLSENPIVPTVQQYLEMMESDHIPAIQQQACEIIELWQRRMFLAPEPEVPEAIADMQRIFLHPAITQEELDKHLTKLLTEAYKRGKASK